MTVLAVEAKTRLIEPSEGTLEDAILGAWEALTARPLGGVPGVSWRAGDLRLQDLRVPARLTPIASAP